MNEKSLEKNLANLERELVALQTAHDVGLGVIRFYEYSEAGVVVFEDDYYYCWILLNVKEGERLNPDITVYLDDSGDYVWTSTVKSETYPGRYAIVVLSIFQKTSILWKIVSTSQLEYHYASSSQEAEDWIGEYF